MRKLDILMIKSFIGPFLLTTAVANFILLIQYLLKYFDDFVGKNLGITVFAELLFYFSLNMLQVALPLGVLIASLMTFGNLGENFELTAIKGSGISLLRTLRPIFLLVFVLSIGAFFFNNYAIPAANLKAYSLLYDIKHTKPALDIKAGIFYNGIPNYSIKAKEKLPDGKTLLDVMIYDHSAGKGNKTVILSDSSLMYTILDDRYLKLELYNGNYYSERKKSKSSIDQLYRTGYYRMDLVFSLASFDLKRRKEDLFQNNRQMKNISELTADIDSFGTVINKAKIGLIENTSRYFQYHIGGEEGTLNKRRIEDDSTIKVLKNPQVAFLSSSGLSGQKQEPKANKKSFEPKTIWDQKEVPIKELQELQFFDGQDTIKTSAKSRAVVELKEILRNPNSLGKGFLESPLAEEILETRLEFILDTLGWDFLEAQLENSTMKKESVFATALSQARSVKVNAQSAQTRVYNARKDKNLYTIEKIQKICSSHGLHSYVYDWSPIGGHY